MTDIHEHFAEELWADETNIGRIAVEIDVESLRSEHNDDALEAAERIRRAVRQEVQTIQDNLDEEHV